MTGIADGQAPAGCKEGSHDRSRKSPRFGHFDKLLIQEPDKFGLVQPIDEPAHERAKVSGGGGNRLPMSRNIRKQEAGDSSGGATGSVVNVSATLCLSVGLAENPGFKTAQFYAARSELAAAPDLHALHVLCRLFGHEFQW